MLRYTKKGIESKERIGTLPLRMSSLLRYRGVNTPEEAERFLHPRLTDLLDPFTMPGMEKAVSIIRQAVREQWGITIYGDYDVDGICATSIMLETLRDLGAQHIRPYIPSRHEEGYGLNADAIELLAKESRLLLTVDCGITNLDEVALAKKRGMTVIVTDHHQLAEKLPEADAVLNPLIEPYAFKRLCGAGVALKITQALLGMDGVEKRIDLAALATVADIVPLMEENRVIVREGMMRMGTSARPGLKKLMELAQVALPVNTGHLGFRLAPRLNAGGRLETAEQCVKLLTTKDEAEATAIATHLNGLNQERQAMEKQIVEQAISAIPAQVNFRTDFAIVILGQEWNNGVIGLAAGRICEKYHFPTIVLSQHGDLAVGSCRSIPGVDIHQMLTACKALYQAEGHGQLFERFGGHSQAAGLTIRAELVPELRRLLNRVIPQGDNCDLTCYIPQKEYELEVPLEAVNMALIDELNQLQPTGYGNPNPVLMARGLHVQEARRVGVGGAHLKLTLLDGAIEDKAVNRKYLERSEKNIDRLIHIVDDLEEISKLEAGAPVLEKECFDVVALVREIADSLEMDAARRRIGIRVGNPHGQPPVPVMADRRRIAQVITNLLSNSIKYGREGGETRIGFVDMFDRVLVEVKDDGIGIAEENIPRVFERFFRVDKSRSREQGGTGLGLAIVKHILEAHGERITLRSKLGEGSAFSFTLSKK